MGPRSLSARRRVGVAFPTGRDSIPSPGSRLTDVQPMPRTGQTVFLIDDDESVRKAVGRLLRATGLAVETFASAEDFLQFSGPATPGCLILDVHLPGLS